MIFTRKQHVCILCLLHIFLGRALFTQSYETVPLIVIKRTPLWYNESFKKQTNISRYIDFQSAVQGVDGPVLSDIDGIDTYVSWINVDGTVYSIQSEYLLPTSVKDIFPSDWIINLNDSNRKRWVVSYYLDVFSSKQRNTILKYENDWLQLVTKKMNESVDYGSGSNWWDNMRIAESLFMFQSSISIGSIRPLCFWILERTQTTNGFTLTVQGDQLVYTMDLERNELLEHNLPFPKYTERKNFDLILVPDGDYMDVYLDTMKTKLASFAKVDSSFLPELNKLIRTNTCNPGNLTFWPRRANGSMDYPPPKAATNVRFTPTAQEIAAFPYATTSNLRLRSSATTSANIVTTIKQGTRLTILSKGAKATIDGITAPWVQVQTETGETGWCFGGYLDPEP